MVRKLTLIVVYLLFNNFMEYWNSFIQLTGIFPKFQCLLSGDVNDKNALPNQNTISTKLSRLIPVNNPSVPPLKQSIVSFSFLVYKNCT